MITKALIKKGEYYDSVTLMLVAKEINTTEGVVDSAVVMGSKENKSILASSGMMLAELENTEDSDLLIVIKAEKENQLDTIFATVDEHFKKVKSKSSDLTDIKPHSIESALKKYPETNFAIISISGKYAAVEAMNALKNNLHVMIFSDNVSLEDELKLKQYGASKGLLVMGPDCGTAIINGVPLAFANVVNSGNIGIVAASGTGLQETSCIISNNGAGISQAIGTGGRDVKKEIGGIMFLEALKALDNDKNTKVILLVSKPPYADVLEKIAVQIKKINKPVVAIFIGGDTTVLKNAGAITASTLEEAGLLAACISKEKVITEIPVLLKDRNEKLGEVAKNEAAKKTPKQKYLRGLFSGGTLCDETQLILKDSMGYVYSNTPLNADFRLADIWKSKKNTIVDMGDDDFTVGRPHPMIDFSLRTKKIVEEASDSEVAIILLDVVLGYGSNLNPSEELVPAIKQAFVLSPTISIICSITGTPKDPQNMEKVKLQLEKAGAIVMKSNAAASVLCSKIAGILYTR